jgi:predicted glycoside hydrolase/deacetylase ChbG (UPF0249 family)
MRHLIVTADDFGLHPSYDAGILEALGAGALDAVSVMALRPEELPAELIAADVAVGLHLDDRGNLDRDEVERQLGRLAELLGRPPDYVDGHHHCHAQPGVAEAVAEIAAERGIAVRSVGDGHRGLLRERGVRTPDRLIGRYEESRPALPPELGELGGGWTEWMTHPGWPDPASGSSYDAGRGEDLEVLLGLSLPDGVTRSDHRRLP